MKRSTALALAVLLALGGCAGKAKQHGPRLIVLGFDGVDPKLAARWMKEGKLPALAALAERGTFQPLRSTNPPQSPVAWSSFATGTGPAKHEIFDFIERDPRTYLPDIGTGRLEPPRFVWGLFPLASAHGVNKRRGEPFWHRVAASGRRVVVLRVPYSFPPDELGGGRMLSGLGVPDLLGTNSTFTYFATDLAPEKAREEVAGGRLVPVVEHEGRVGVTLPGPVDPRGRERDRLTLPLRITIDRAGKAASISLAGREERVPVGGWSGWFEVRFPVNPLFSVYGLCRFYLVSVEPALRLYMSPLNYHPDHPYAPFTFPGGFAAGLARDIGFYKTVGWSKDTSALNAEVIDDGTFLDDLFRTMEEEWAATLHELRAGDWDLLVSVFTETDRASHMFYRLLDPRHPRYDPALAARYGDAVLWVYERMDNIVGEIMRFVDERTTLILVSDHGFHSFRRGFNLNTWLKRAGLLVQRPLPEEEASRDFFPGVDWSRTKAYALGTGQIYVNLRGREGQGTVEPGSEYERVVDRIVRGIEAVRDPATGERVVSRVYRGQDIFPGADPERAPDIQVAFREGYRTSWATPLGGIPRALFTPNRRKWSGDHAASDVRDTSGVIFASRRLAVPDPAIVDVAPTVLAFFGIPVPPRMDGKALFE